jgi:hypothetical protein
MQKNYQLPAFNLVPYAAVLSGKLSAIYITRGLLEELLYFVAIY